MTAVASGQRLFVGGRERGAVLVFTVTPSGTVADSRLSHGAWCIIKNLRINCPTELENRRDYNRTFSISMEVAPAIGTTTAFGPLWGTQDQATRIANAAGAYTYAIPLSIPSFQGQPIPLSKLRTQVFIELDLAPVVECWESGAAPNLAYTVTNVEFHYDEIVSPAYEQYVAQRMGSSGLQLGHMEAEVVPLAPTSAAVMRLPIATRHDAVDGFMVQTQTRNYSSTLASTDKYILSQPTGLQSYQLYFEGQYQPQQPVDCTGNAPHAYLYSLRYMERGNRSYNAMGRIEKAPLITNADFITDRFYEFLPINGLARDGLVSLKGNAGFTADAQITHVYAAPPVDLTQYIITFYYKNVFVDKMGFLKANQI